MSHIVEFSVAGLAGRDKPYEQKLDRHVNVFFGENGSGKTSLLKILHSAISGKTSVLDRAPFTSASVDVYSVKYAKVFHRTIELDPATQFQENPSSESSLVNWNRYLLKQIHYPNLTFGAEPDATGQPQFVYKPTPNWSIDPSPPADFKGGFADRYLPTSRVYQSSTATPELQLSASSLNEAQLDAYFAESIKNLWTSYSADIAREVSKAQQKGLANILKAVLSTSKAKRKRAGDSSKAYSRVAAFLNRQPGFSDVLGPLDEFSKRYEADPRLKSIVRDIDTVETEIERATAPRELLKSLIQRMFSRKQVEFSEKTIEIETANHIKIDLSQLSSGEKQLLRVFIETLMAGENTILIDEPELSLHIDWQRSLVQALTLLNPKAQIILATHSPEIMAELKEDVIFKL